MFTILTLAAAGLVSLAGHTPGSKETSTSTTARTVLVQNNRKVPVTVILEYGPFDHRLGTVPATRTAALALPRWVAPGGESYRLFVRSEGSDEMKTPAFSIAPHRQLSLLVPRVKVFAPAPRDTMIQRVPAAEYRDATITVDNLRNSPVSVVASRDAFDTRLGVVNAQSRRTLVIPRELTRPDQSVKIFVEENGAFDLASNLLQVKGAEHLGIRVPPR